MTLKYPIIPLGNCRRIPARGPLLGRKIFYVL